MLGYTVSSRTVWNMWELVSKKLKIKFSGKSSCQEKWKLKRKWGEERRGEGRDHYIGAEMQSGPGMGHMWLVRMDQRLSLKDSVLGQLLTCHHQLQTVITSWRFISPKVFTVVMPSISVCYILQTELKHLLGSLWGTNIHLNTRYKKG